MGCSSVERAPHRLPIGRQLCRLAQHGQNGEALRLGGGVAAVLFLLDGASDDLTVLALHAIWKMSAHHPPIKAAVRDLGGLPRLVSCAGPSNPKPPNNPPTAFVLSRAEQSPMKAIFVAEILVADRARLARGLAGCCGRWSSAARRRRAARRRAPFGSSRAAARRTRRRCARAAPSSPSASCSSRRASAQPAAQAPLRTPALSARHLTSG